MCLYEYIPVGHCTISEEENNMPSFLIGRESNKTKERIISSKDKMMEFCHFYHNIYWKKTTSSYWETQKISMT